MNFDSERELTDHVNSKLDDFLNRFEKGFDPIWPSQIEYGKTIIALSSGALILSITLLQFLSNYLEKTSANWLLLASWILFCIAILFGAYRFNIVSKIKAYKYSYNLMRVAILEKAVDIFDTDLDLNKLNKVFIEEFRKAMEETRKSIKYFQVSNHIMVGSFTFGIIALTIFASINLPL